MPTVACVGIAVHDTVFELDDDPVFAHKNFASSVYATSGGPVVNAAKAVVDLGGDAAVVSRVGDDVFGDAIIHDLATRGVKTDGIERFRQTPSSVSSVMVHPDGERTIVNATDRDLLNPPNTRMADVVDAAEAVLVDVRWIPGSRSAINIAMTAGTPTIVDFDTSRGEVPSDFIEIASHVIFSHDALLSVSGAVSPGDGIAALARTTDAVVGVTLGEQGSLWVVDGHVVTVPGFSTRIVSTLGAGDVFHGAFAFGIAEGRDVLESAEWASAAAAVFCSLGRHSDGILSREAVDMMRGSR
jgi:sulfofructose kinase